MEDELTISVHGDERRIIFDDVFADSKRLFDLKRQLAYKSLGYHNVHELELDGSGFRAVCPVCSDVHDMHQSKTTKHLDYSLDTFLPWWLEKHGEKFEEFIDGLVDDTDFRYLIDRGDVDSVRSAIRDYALKELDLGIRSNHNVYFAECDSWISYFYERSAIPHKAYRDGQVVGVYRPLIDAHGKVFWEQPGASWG